MIDCKSLGGFISTVFIFKINQQIETDITFITLTAVGFSTLLYNIMRIKNEWRKTNKNEKIS